MGIDVGISLEEELGFVVGDAVGARDGLLVGYGVGALVGVLVGLWSMHARNLFVEMSFHFQIFQIHLNHRFRYRPSQAYPALQRPNQVLPSPQPRLRPRPLLKLQRHVPPSHQQQLQPGPY